MKSRFFRIKRWFRHRYQKLTRGFSDAELWNLDHTIAEFVLPRLKAFKASNGAYPGCETMETPEKWDAALDDMIFAMQLITDKWSGPQATREEMARCDTGLQLFGEWFRALWW